MFPIVPSYLPLCLIYASLNWIIIGSDNGLSPVRRQAIIYTKDDIVPISPQGTDLNEIFVENNQISLMKSYLNLSSEIIPTLCSLGDELTVPININE